MPPAPLAVDRFTFDRLLITLLFLAIALAACLMPAQNDTWWQLSAGRDMWRTHTVLVRDTFSHTAYGAFWPNHEWLSQALFYAIYAVGGLPLLTLAAAAAVVGAWAVVWNQTPASTRTRFVLIALVVVAACGGWSPRPQVLSLLLTALTMALLRTRRYGWLPLVFLLWANLHGGVLLGVWLLVAALGASLVEHPESSRRLLAMSGLSICATLLTPLGVDYWIEIVRSLGRIRELGIAEWAPPRLTDPQLAAFWLILAALAALGVARGRRLWDDPAARADGQLTLCALALALAPLALTAVRNVAPFLMLAVPAIAALAPPRLILVARRPASRPRLNAALAACALILTVSAPVVAYATGAAHLAWTPLPPASIAALETCRGNLYNRYDEGGYLIWFAPSHKVFLDGRQDPYSPALIAEQVRVETTGDFGDTFRRYDIGCTYTPAESIVTAKLLGAGWTPLYRDARWAVLMRPEARPSDRRGRRTSPAGTMLQAQR
jgi:hypothetical protein